MAKRTVDALGEEGHRKQTDSLGEVEVPADKLWGAQTQRSLDHFSIGRDLMPREMITAYAILKRASANANYAGKRLGEEQHRFNIEACDEILAGQHHDMFPSHVWVTGSGTQSIKRGLNPPPIPVRSNSGRRRSQDQRRCAAPPGSATGPLSTSHRPAGAREGTERSRHRPAKSAANFEMARNQLKPGMPAPFGR
jgi:hypothetical protein